MSRNTCWFISWIRRHVVFNPFRTNPIRSVGIVGKSRADNMPINSRYLCTGVVSWKVTQIFSRTGFTKTFKCSIHQCIWLGIGKLQRGDRGIWNLERHEPNVHSCWINRHVPTKTIRLSYLRHGLVFRAACTLSSVQRPRKQRVRHSVLYLWYSRRHHSVPNIWKHPISRPSNNLYPRHLHHDGRSGSCNDTWHSCPSRWITDHAAE